MRVRYWNHPKVLVTVEGWHVEQEVMNLSCMTLSFNYYKVRTFWHLWTKYRTNTKPSTGYKIRQIKMQIIVRRKLLGCEQNETTTKKRGWNNKKRIQKVGKRKHRGDIQGFMLPITANQLYDVRKKKRELTSRFQSVDP